MKEFLYISRESYTTRNVVVTAFCVCLCVCLSVCVCLSAATCPQYCTDPDVTWRNDKVCPLVVHYWADLHSVHGFHCYNNIAQTRNVSECLYSLYAWLKSINIWQCVLPWKCIGVIQFGSSSSRAFVERLFFLCV